MNDIERIGSKIYEIRGQKVMLDYDIAELYGVETSQRLPIESHMGT